MKMEMDMKADLLIVDDRPENLLVLEEILHRPNLNIVKASSGNEALRLLFKYDFALILLDVQMPDMDGFETAELVRGSRKTKHIPIIFVTAISKEQKHIFKGYESGAVDYLFKPIDPEILKSKVDIFLDIHEQKKSLEMITHELEQTVSELKQAKAQLQNAKSNAERKREIAEAANKKIMDSLQYARVIQRSLLPDPDETQYYLPDSFIIWMPRDIVGGDIYHTECFDDGIIIAIIDCTGHGVPGAFMTMIASSGLRRIIRTEKCHDPAEILKWLNFIIKTSLQQDTEYALSDDGLDAAVCLAKPEENTLIFAGAHMPLCYVRNKKNFTIKGNKQSIGYKKSDLSFNYANHTIQIEEGMKFYLASDGFTDQLGGTRGVRFGNRRFRELILKASSAPFDTQSDLFLKTFDEYKGENEAVDDVTVLGFGFDRKGRKDRRRGDFDIREAFVERRRKKV